MNGGARVLSDTGYPATAGGAAPPAAAAAAPAPASGECQSCGGGARNAPAASGTSGFVYAIGRITPQFPDLGVEKEFAQLGGADAGGRGGALENDRLIEILRDPATFYLARQLCWVFSTGDVDAFVIAPRDEAQMREIVDSLPSAERADRTIQVVVGAMGPSLLGTACAAAVLPSVMIDQHLTFPLDDFLDALAAEEGGGKKEKGQGKADERFRAVARDLFARLTRRTDNRGVSDEHRAANYLALRYPQLYRLAAQADADEKSLTEVQLRRSPGATRKVVAVRLVFRTRRTDMVERYQCLVDVTDRFPFLSSPLSPVYD